MKISLIGATGFVGNAIVNELLERNFQVTAIARNTDKITIENENLEKKMYGFCDELNSKDIKLKDQISNSICVSICFHI